MTKEELKIIWHHCVKNKDEILASDQCGCFYCLSIFESGLVKQWVDGGTTALCPICSIDSVIGDANINITEELLEQLQMMYFPWSGKGNHQVD